MSAPDELSDEARRERVETLYRRSKPHFPEVPDLTADELRRLLDEDEPLVIVDCRSPAEQEVSRIPGAVTIAELEADPPEPGSATVVTYCTVGHRSGLYARRLHAAGWPVRNLAGSILAWTHAGGELVDPDGESTDRVHVFGPKWSFAASGYRPVW